MQVERREPLLVEPHRLGAVRQFPFQIGAAPVHDRHEIVADDLDARRGDRFEAGDPGLDRTRSLAPEPLDVVGHRNRFHHRPGQRRTTGLAVLDQVLALLDSRSRPGFADRHLMQRRHNIGGAGLADIVERYGIIGPVPPPSLQHHAESPERKFYCAVSTTLTLCERRSASRIASGATASGRWAVTSAITSTLPSAISSTAVKNSAPKRNEPRRSISLAITALAGIGICPPGRLPT